MPKSRSKRLSTKATPSLFLKVIGILSLVILGAGLFFGVQLIQRQQDLRQQAASQKPLSVTMSGRSNLESKTLLIDLAVNSQNKNMVGIGLKGRVQGVPKARVKVSPRNVMNLQTIVNEVTQDGDDTVFQLYLFASIDENKPANTQGNDVTVATVEISQPASSGVRVALNQATSIEIVGDDATPLKIADAQTFTLESTTPPTAQPTTNPTSQPENKKGCNQNCSADYECESGMICHSGQCRRSDRLTDSTCGNIPDQGIHRGCNEYCANSGECDSKYTCYFNRCRLGQNLNDTECRVPTPRPVVTTGSTGTGGTPRSATPRPTTIPVTITVDSTPRPTSTPRPSTSPTASAKPSASPSSTPRTTTRPSATPRPDEETSESGGSPLRTIIIIVLVIGIVGALVFAAYKFLLGSGLPY